MKLIPPGSIVKVVKPIHGSTCYGYVLRKLRTRWSVAVLCHPTDIPGSRWSLPEDYVKLVPDAQVPDRVWTALAKWRLTHGA